MAFIGSDSESRNKTSKVHVLVFIVASLIYASDSRMKRMLFAA